MMALYVILVVLVSILTVVSLVGIVIFVLSGCELGEVLVATLIAVALAFGCGAGATAVEKSHTETRVEYIQCVVDKCDITDNKCYISAGGYLIEVTPEEYATLNVGEDTVMVEITTKTVFGEARKPTIALKG